MRHSTIKTRHQPKIERFDVKAEKERRAYLCLVQGGSVAQAAAKAGWCVATLYNRGVVERYKRFLMKSQDTQAG